MSASMGPPVIEGLFTLDAAEPALLGSRCSACGTFYFPKQTNFCRNPACESERFDEVPLSRTGKLWSFTNACYKPPEPYIAADPFVPYAIAAVELDAEKMIVLGQVVEGVGVEHLKAGMSMELVLENIAGQDGERVTWKWKPTEAKA
jgi:uncharacterized OB-fold protein